MKFNDRLQCLLPVTGRSGVVQRSLFFPPLSWHVTLPLFAPTTFVLVRSLGAHSSLFSGSRQIFTFRRLAVLFICFSCAGLLIMPIKTPLLTSFSELLCPHLLKSFFEDFQRQIGHSALNYAAANIDVSISQKAKLENKKVIFLGLMKVAEIFCVGVEGQVKQLLSDTTRSTYIHIYLYFLQHHESEDKPVAV